MNACGCQMNACHCLHTHLTGYRSVYFMSFFKHTFPLTRHILTINALNPTHFNILSHLFYTVHDSTLRTQLHRLYSAHSNIAQEITIICVTLYVYKYFLDLQLYPPLECTRKIQYVICRHINFARPCKCRRDALRVNY